MGRLPSDRSDSTNWQIDFLDRVQVVGTLERNPMNPTEDTPPAILELLAATPPAPRHITLHVTVDSVQGQRAYWMTEGGVVFMRRLDGTLVKTDEQQTRRVMKGLELARHSKSFTVRGRVADAAELDEARGLLAV
jgi:hypothetical protein